MVTSEAKAEANRRKRPYAATGPRTDEGGPNRAETPEPETGYRDRENHSMTTKMPSWTSFCAPLFSNIRPRMTMNSWSQRAPLWS